MRRSRIRAGWVRPLASLWVCVWCKAANDGYSPPTIRPRRLLATLTGDMASHGLEFASREPQQEQGPRRPAGADRNHERGAGCRITQVHGDVFGLIVLARNALSNTGAQLWCKLSDGPVSSRRRRRLHSRS